VSGLRFSYDPQVEPGSRVSNVEVGGRPIEPAATYSVATNDFMANGGDGYTAFREGRMLIDPNAAQIAASQVIDYVQRKGSVAPRVEGRITSLR
jgi:2',3'-cyclic-nucleotide 2'-phosphodiesterase (5'-nucleotidase family)